MKVKSEFIEVTSRHCIFQNLGCVVQERKRKKEVGLRENAEGTKGKILGILFLGCGLSYVISKAWSAEEGDTVLLPSQMINLQNKFSTPSPVPLAGLNTSHYEACALCPHTETLGGQVYVYASASLALRSKMVTFAGVQHFYQSRL